MTIKLRQHNKVFNIKHIWLSIQLNYWKPLLNANHQDINPHDKATSVLPHFHNLHLHVYASHINSSRGHRWKIHGYCWHYILVYFDVLQVVTLDRTASHSFTSASSSMSTSSALSNLPTTHSLDLVGAFASFSSKRRGRFWVTWPARKKSTCKIDILETTVFYLNSYKTTLIDVSASHGFYFI